MCKTTLESTRSYLSAKWQKSSSTTSSRSSFAPEYQLDHQVSDAYKGMFYTTNRRILTFVAITISHQSLSLSLPFSYPANGWKLHFPSLSLNPIGSNHFQSLMHHLGLYF
ncbi:hypothetical protein TorRG33x02_173540 [Trema orientale]|uniref:Uncharacterized protein n=1 Tax=Trema orientale TaxID=63057 RepID=A0A2P5EMN3_TREOI|nr:hypothetical protein TorRG33x02_173540 [Trema orientale]